MIETMTANGARVIAEPNPALHGFSLSLYLKAGCLYETEQESGLTHFFEHIAVRNLNAHYNSALYRLLDQTGLTFNASTGQDCVQFEIVGAKKHFRTAADILSRLFEPIVLSAREIDIERKRIKAEIREEDEKSTLYQFRSEQVWENTSLSRSVLGNIKTLNRIGKHTLIAAQKLLLSKENIFFYVTGAFEQDDLNALLSLLSTAPIPSGAPERTGLAPIPPTFGDRTRDIRVKKGEQTMLSFSFDLYAEEYTDAERTLLYDLIFSGEACLFYQELSEKTGYIYSFSPSVETFRNLSVLSVQFEVQPKDLLPAAKCAASIFSSLTEHLTEDLDRVRPPYVDNADLLLDDCSAYNWTRAYETLFLSLPYPDLTSRKAAYESVTPHRLLSLAKTVFTPARMTVCVKGNLEPPLIRELEKTIYDTLTRNS